MKYKSKTNSRRSVYKRDTPPQPFPSKTYKTHDGDIVYIIHIKNHFLVKELNTIAYDAGG
jgi:crotonobetainyl-CoA:carnitine CoA-transferase CaiB-like acyl-CoA transferase